MPNMRLWMHGIDPERPAPCANALARAGFSIVVASGEGVTESVRDAGMESWVCGGAFRIAGPETESDLMAVGISGEKQEWFRSGCPNDRTIRERNLEEYRAMAELPGVTGVMVDGCRFASPASGIESFLTCFCERCRAKADELGFDFEAMRRDVAALREGLGDTLHRSHWSRNWLANPVGLLEYLTAHPGIGMWLGFREACATEHLAAVSEILRAGGKRVGMYIFTPCLATLVGQSYRRLQPHVDVFAPMIYRNYLHSPGPACLNWEITNIPAELGLEATVSEKLVMRFILAWLGFSGMFHTPTITEIRAALPSACIGIETGRARTLLGPQVELAPIVTIDDPAIRETASLAEESGANGLNFFKFEPQWRALLETLF